MKYGNCLIGLIILMFEDSFQGRILMVPQRDSVLPHLMYKIKTGIWHYKRRRHLLPNCISFLWFEGNFRKVKNG